MSIPLIVDANSYQYPAQGDKANTGWGGQATSWASAVTAALTKLGLGGTLSPVGNAVINIDSTSKGILIPRMTTAQRDAITSPTNSLLIFNTTLKVVQYYDLSVSTWISIGARLPDNAIFSGTLQVNGNITGLGSLTLSGALQATTGNFSGVIYADDDTTANTPVISFTGDTNTGIGRSAADTIDLITNGNSRFRIESTGQIKAVYESTLGTDYNTQLDNGYLCRAWVNFDGTSSNLTGTYTRSGNTITVSVTSHGLSTGQTVYLDFTSGGATDGIYVVTVINANSYTVIDTASGTITTSNVTQFRYIRASGNVSSITDNTTGDYTVNFVTPIPDVNYTNVFGQQYDNSAGASPYFMGIRAEFGVITTKTTSALRVCTANFSGTKTDAVDVNVAIFR